MHKLFFIITISLLINNSVASNTLVQSESTRLPSNVMEISTHSEPREGHLWNTIRNLHIEETGAARIPFTIFPNSYLETLTQLSSAQQTSKINNEGSLKIDLMFAAGDYFPGEYTYLLWNSYEGKLPILNLTSNEITTNLEHRKIGESHSQLLLKLTIHSPFSVIATDEETTDNEENSINND